VFASTLPDFGSPSSPAFVSFAVCFLLTLAALWRRESREEIRWAAFVGAFIGAGVGLLAYAFDLITGLY